MNSSIARDNHFTMERIQRRKELIREASGRGGYIWSNKQLHNALLWFTTPVDDESASGNPNERNGDKRDFQMFVESLLRNPGILCNRPLVGKKRLRDDDELKGPLLPHILSFLGVKCKERNEQCADKSEKYEISLESILTTVLASIANARTNTDEPQQSTQEPQQLWHHDKGKTQEFLKYFLQPRTIINSTYAAHLYTQYLEMATKTEEVDDSNNNIPSRALLFLEKVRALAVIKQEVAEVFLLMILEPIRRQLAHNNYNWVDAISSDFTFNAPDSDVEEDRAFRHLSRTVVGIVTIHNIYQFPSTLVATLGQIYFAIAKELLDKLISCAIDSYGQIPKFVANQAMRSLDSCDGLLDSDPRLIYEKCVSTCKEWIATSANMSSLFSDIIDIRLMAFQQNECDDGIQALNEFKSGSLEIDLQNSGNCN